MKLNPENPYLQNPAEKTTERLDNYSMSNKKNIRLLRV